MENRNTITIKFDGQVIKVEMPDMGVFTGETTLTFHWKEGQIRKALVMKQGSVEIMPLETLSTIDSNSSGGV